MAEPKYKEFFQLMLKQNQEVFDGFKEVHDKFIENPTKWRDEFNEKGREVQDIVRIYENRLCRQSEGAGFSKFSTKLADKFQAEVKNYFPNYDFIGIE